MIHTWRNIVDFIFPPSPSMVLLRQYKNVPITDTYSELCVHDTITLSRYHDPLIHACVTAGKFENNLEALKRLSPLLVMYLERHNIPLATTVCIPIPLHPTRERERGYNQIVEILKPLQKSHRLYVVPLLKRTRATKVQSHQNRADRLTNVVGAFVYHPLPLNRTPTHILIIDDVITTGSTLQSARAALAPHLPQGATLITIAFAH
ncbi:MAG: hypothetical protein RLZZ70_406 [Candidatus Parcubacteria bacterium]|jgi:predicted amidophosphoribosyltransferase